MFDYFQGELVAKAPEGVTLDVRGVGYQLQVPFSTYSSLPESGLVLLYAHLVVREDEWRLFGFSTEAERTVFRRLISVSGVGPMTAIQMLSQANVEEIVTSIVTGDTRFLKSMKGIGDKTAQRIALELKEPMRRLGGKVQGAQIGGAPAPSGGGLSDDAVAVLVSLGYSESQADKAVRKAEKAGADATSLEDLVKFALQHV
ncbi:MAG: Holliday junction branch migration protein RuvA [Planctomycetota bacterium]